mmetsp:Transcript_3413/g.7173  ORF Transcript_3413/g.7173 Transcript_3413/m.7173 type:complete len:200 (-) Transcript_3413:764-1363(-)
MSWTSRTPATRSSAGSWPSPPAAPPPRRGPRWSSASSPPSSTTAARASCSGCTSTIHSTPSRCTAAAEPLACSWSAFSRPRSTATPITQTARWSTASSMEARDCYSPPSSAGCSSSASGSAPLRRSSSAHSSCRASSASPPKSSTMASMSRSTVALPTPTTPTRPPNRPPNRPPKPPQTLCRSSLPSPTSTRWLPTTWR